MKKQLLWLCLAIFSLAACTKETTKTNENDPFPMIGDTPEITLMKVSKTTIQQYVDSLVFTIQYLDGNGDVGTEDPDTPSIVVVDTRDPDLLVFEYHLPPQGPPDTEIILQGTLDIVLDNSILIDMNNTSEQTSFKIRMTDRAGNWSNEVETETITITQ